MQRRRRSMTVSGRSAVRRCGKCRTSSTTWRRKSMRSSPAAPMADSTVLAAPEAPTSVVWQERRVGTGTLRTYRTTVDIDDVLPNNRQPRLGPKEDPELQRQIEANEGVFEPLLLEPHPTLKEKLQIVDGDRR